MVGGSALTPTLASAALERGIDAFVGYGMSETCPVLSIAHLAKADLQASAEKQLDLRCKTGLPLPLVDLRVVDPEMRDVVHDGKTTGELVVRSPWLTQAYLDAPEASEALWAGGYLHTQDIGHIDAQGYVKDYRPHPRCDQDRREWTSSLELESVIQTLDAVQEVAVIGVPDEKWGERPLALVVLKPEFEGKVSAHELRNAAARLVESTRHFAPWCAAANSFRQGIAENQCRQDQQAGNARNTGADGVKRELL